MTDRAAVTVVTRAFLPAVRVLAETLSEHHADARLAVVVVDDVAPDATNEPFQVLSPLELGLSERELHRRAMLFDPQGLISSLRSVALRHLLDRGARSVLLLDADMLVLAPLDDLWELAAAHGVVLSPHIVDPLEPPDAEHVYLLAGTFNGGFLAVGARGRPFLDWLAEHVRRECVRDLERGLLYSQTWLNLVPALFDHVVLRDAGVNVTPHSLGHRDIRLDGGRWLLDGAPVRLFHFTGFDPSAPAVLSRHFADERGGVDDRPGLAALCDEYARRLRARGWPSGEEYEWARLRGGRPIDAAMKARYAEALAAAEREGAGEPPDPFASTPAFLDWFAGGNVQYAVEPGAPEVTIVVPTHNALRYVRRLLTTLPKTRAVRYEVIVVDNASRRATRAFVRAMRRLRRIDRLILNEHNLLFAAANNQGAAAADPRSRYVLLLNSDVEVRDPCWLRRLLDLHRRGATGLGLLDDVAGTRADGYCLLVDRDLYDRYRLDEGFAWWWSSSKLQAELLRDGYSVRAIPDHEDLVVHHGGGSGSDFAGAAGMDTPPEAVREWFGTAAAEVVRASADAQPA